MKPAPGRSTAGELFSIYGGRQYYQLCSYYYRVLPVAWLRSTNAQGNGYLHDSRYVELRVSMALNR